MIRNFQKIKTLSDFENLDMPKLVRSMPTSFSHVPSDTQMVLRMLVRPKYGEFKIPASLEWLREAILAAAVADEALTNIRQSFCYVTVRRGLVCTKTDDEWHFDGASFRTDIVPERNYVWVSSHGTEYKLGGLCLPPDFDPNKHNLFTLAERQLKGSQILSCTPMYWYMLSPFVLHRRPPTSNGMQRTMIRIAFTDIEWRDVNNTQNPLLYAPAYGRDPVKTFRDKLTNYYDEHGDFHEPEPE